MPDQKLESRADVDTIKIALGNKDFLNYLSRIPDQQLIDPNKPETIKRQWALFQLKNKVYFHLREIYTNKIREELGIELGDENWKSMNDYLETRIFIAPDGLISLAQKIQKFSEMPGRIELRKKFIYSLGGEKKFQEVEALLAEVAENNKDKGIIKKCLSLLHRAGIQNFEWTKLKPVSKAIGETRIGKTLLLTAKLAGYMGQGAIRAYDTLRLTIMGAATLGENILRGPVPDKRLEKEEELKNKFDIDPRTAGESLAKVREHLNKITKAKKDRAGMEEELNALRAYIFDENLMPAMLAAETARQKVGEGFKQLITESKQGTGPIEKILEIKNALDKLLARQREATFDYTKGLGREKIDEWANKVLEMRAKHALGKAIENITIETHDNPLAKLEEEVSPFVIGNQTAGDFFVKALRELIDKKNLDNDKTILLKMLLAKLEMERIEKEISAPATWAEKTKAGIDKAFS